MTALDGFLTDHAAAVAAAIDAGVHDVVVKTDTAELDLILAVAETLEASGYKAVVVAPPRGHIDTPALALLDCAVELDRHALVPDVLKAWSQRTAWWERLNDLHGWLKTSASDGVVLVCDDPSYWLPPQSESGRRAEEAADLLLRDNGCAKVVVGGRSQLPYSTQVLAPADDLTRRLLDDVAAWGALWETVERLRAAELPIGELHPATLRLFVGLTAACPDIPRRDVANAPRQLLAERLATITSRDITLRRVWAAWARASVPRRGMDDAWIALSTNRIVDPVHRDLFEVCLIEGRSRKVLVAEARIAAWRQPDDSYARRVQDAVAGELSDQFVAEFEKCTAQGRADALRYGGEALFAASLLSDVEMPSRVPPAFSDQVDAIGMTALERGRLQPAQEAFAQAADFDEEDALARHYFGYSLDVAGVEPRRIEAEYRGAVALEGRHPTWHARLISFLIVQGRSHDAHADWLGAIGRLSAPGGDGSLAEYATLHLPVAANLLRRAELDFAAEVLEDVPHWARPELVGYEDQRRRLETMRFALEHGSYVPAHRLRERWWRDGPEALRRQLPDGRVLSLWVAARIEAENEDDLELEVAIIENGKPPATGTSRLSRRDLARLSDDAARAALVGVGDFLELGYYGEDFEEPLIHVLDPPPWDAGAQTPLDPSRFLRRAVWS